MLLATAESALRMGLIALRIGPGLLSGLPPAVLGWTWAGEGPAMVWGIIVGVLLSLGLTGASVLALRRWGQASRNRDLLTAMPNSSAQVAKSLLQPASNSDRIVTTDTNQLPRS